MRASFVASIVLAVSTALVALVGPVSAAPLPVPHDITVGVRAEAANPGGSLPDSNDWSCKPTAEHPRPVVLVHATFLNRQVNWSTYVPLLRNEGYCVFALTYGTIPGTAWPLSAIGGIGSMKDSAHQLGAFVDDVLAATGADKVDVVAHSQGTLMPNYYVKFLGGAAKVDKYVSLTPLWRGGGQSPAVDDPEIGAPYALDPAQRELIGRACAACLEMEPGSEFIRQINDGGLYAPGVTYTNIMTRYDDIVVPYTSGFVPGPNTTNIVVQDQCPQDMSHHMGMAGSPVAAGHVLNALDPEHQRPVPCLAVQPNTGAPLR
ncbi:alpha/beta fold hydrolase [Rhodococcus spelaei]|uniref:Alpha/beta fold hydrolase n=1 Tax=Rhodococcus spelaei TaxID=2546320 RepID=A0A541BLY6_9NOCA|nr:alpha/beta fold hydrolase [Rhodococcus spelaei]TQF73342.1 alpha/beta fold hydrolase [Rhodococcus spelaei]